MAWPWAFLDLTKEEKYARRQVLDFYATIAQFSALIPVLCFLSARLTYFLLSRIWAETDGRDGHGEYQQVGEAPPSSPGRKAARLSSSRGFAGWARRLVWWLDGDVELLGQTWGQRDEWVLGLVWTLWLLTLSVVGTGRDYFHLCKRFGIIAMSQLPLHYLLANKILNPISFVFRSSHEHVNRYHRVLARIISLLLAIHVILYGTSFFVKGIWWEKMRSRVVLLGILGTITVAAITTTALRTVRDRAYRVFFVTHVIGGFAIPVIIFFHAHGARIYVVEAVLAFTADLIVRKVATTNSPATVELITGTNLVKVTLEVPATKAADIATKPGCHLYLEVPRSGRVKRGPISNNLVDFIHNPFTVAAVDQMNNTITLVARSRSGPISQHLSHLAALPPSPDQARVTLGFEGPYGLIGHRYQDLINSGANRILLVAGGVGATFVLPLYHAILHENPKAKVQFVWALRTAGEAVWAVSPSDSSGKSILDDKHVHMFLTGDLEAPSSPLGPPVGGSAVEMSAIARGGADSSFARSRKRPDFDKIVDDTFGKGAEEMVAVLICGPAGMHKDVKRRVGRWVRKGRQVWWHSETFGW